MYIRNQIFARARLVAAVLLLCLLPVAAQSGAAVSAVTQAAGALVAQQEAGLSIDWSGLGRVAGEMVDAAFTNNSSAPMTVKLIPGIVLADNDGESQSIMLEINTEFELAPGEAVALESVRAYCLEHEKDPPALGQGVDYQVVTDVSGFAPAIKNLWAGLRLDLNGQYQPVLKPIQHRTLVIQRAIWASLGEPNPGSQEKLTTDLKKDAATGEHGLSDDKIEWLSGRIWGDVEKTIQESPAE